MFPAKMLRPFDFRAKMLNSSIFAANFLNLFEVSARIRSLNFWILAMVNFNFQNVFIFLQKKRILPKFKVAFAFAICDAGK